MKLKAIILDLDGTVLTSEKTISSKTQEKLIQLQKQGVKIILASGRASAAMESTAEALELGLYDGYYISYNGACVTDASNHELIYKKPILNEDAVELLKTLEQFSVIPMIEDGEVMYVRNVYEKDIPIASGSDTFINIVEYESRGGGYKLHEVTHLYENIDYPIYKVLVAGDPTYLQENYKKFSSPFKDKLTSSFSAPFFYEFTDLGVDKGETLKILLETLNIDPKDTIAFGDGHNDISLLKVAGIGVAMGNAHEDVVEIADATTKSNNEDGIAHFLESLEKENN